MSNSYKTLLKIAVISTLIAIIFGITESSVSDGIVKYLSPPIAMLAGAIGILSFIAFLIALVVGANKGK
ncbi:hypothetical protein [Dyadobacter sp. CY323]|uniref:hypothetical protein n=1 Tax=Dyadobacter sp. CY323 TaxID=2907302 RepID=UPI001F2AE1CD|nr:hypothetical protein [Dyadobacter sp. CY323]MCE6993123.1 hypothetical protein [Dyadobacter sp. CY323]